jgi:hypothetical protein
VTTLWRAQLLSPECLQLLLGLNPASIKVNTTFSFHLSQCICGHYAWVIPIAALLLRDSDDSTSPSAISTVFPLKIMRIAFGQVGFHPISYVAHWSSNLSFVHSICTACNFLLCQTGVFHFNNAQYVTHWAQWAGRFGKTFMLSSTHVFEGTFLSNRILSLICCIRL